MFHVMYLWCAFHSLEYVHLCTYGWYVSSDQTLKIMGAYVLKIYLYNFYIFRARHCCVNEHVRHEWCVVKKLGQIFVRSWNSRPEPSRYQCTIMVWGTVFTNDCCSRPVGSKTKVIQPLTSCLVTMNMSDINDMCGQNVRPDFCQILKFSPWTK